VRGTAWKERANTLFSRNLRTAKKAAQKAIDIFASHPGLGQELAKARLLMAKIYREEGNSADAIREVRECAESFKEYGDTTYYSMARFIEAWIYFGQKQFRDAYSIVSDLVEEAERGNNVLALARALLFAASCARELDEHDRAREMRARALENFEEADAASELPRVRWEHAIVLAGEGRPGEAIFQLYKVRSEFLRFGMIISAASASLDMVRLKYERGEDVAGTARELVTTFVEAGLTQNAIEALAYIREEARAGALTARKIQAARDFFSALEQHPARLFVPPPSEEDER
jgi:tetratricopeptide (TPR) repeat protein